MGATSLSQRVVKPASVLPNSPLHREQRACPAGAPRPSLKDTGQLAEAQRDAGSDGAGTPSGGSGAGAPLPHVQVTAGAAATAAAPTAVTAKFSSQS